MEHRRIEPTAWFDPEADSRGSTATTSVWTGGATVPVEGRTLCFVLTVEVRRDFCTEYLVGSNSVLT